MSRQAGPAIDYLDGPSSDALLDKPVEVTIFKMNGKWDLDVSKTDEPVMRNRQNTKISSAAKKWTNRPVAGGHTAPEFIRVKDHTAVVVRVGESVKFTCEKPFLIWVGRDKNV